MVPIIKTTDASLAKKLSDSGYVSYVETTDGKDVQCFIGDDVIELILASEYADAQYTVCKHMTF